MADSQSSLGRVADCLPEAVFTVTSDGRVLDANRAAVKLFCISNDQIKTMRLAQLLNDPAGKIPGYLRHCTMSREPVLGMLNLRIDAPDTTYRCEGAVLEPARPGRPAVVFMRLLPRRTATRQFALLTERIDSLGREVENRLSVEQVLDSQRQILEQIAQGAPLKQILHELVSFIDNRSRAGARSSILLMDATNGTLHHGAAPAIPNDYCDAVDGLKIGPDVGSCGSAAFNNEVINVSDIQTDHRWAPFVDLANAAGLRACYSTPIAGEDNAVLGTFALYYNEPRDPDPDDKRLLALLTRTAAIAIERNKAAAEIRDLLERERVARAEAEEANRSKDEFLAMVSHELRNPLNAILGWAKVLDMGPADADTLEQGIAAIERNASLQAQLINEILDYSRIKAGKLRLDLEPADIVELVRAAVESARPAAMAGKIALSFLNEGPSQQIVSIDSARIEQSVNNIIGNAIKFTPEGGQITVCLGGDEQELEIRVRDTGCGIEQEFLPHVFDRFRQEDGSRQRKHEGLGLGLAIVQQLVELHKGNITAESDGPGTGSCFIVRIPRLQRKKPTRTVAAYTASLKGLKILAVDDAADTRSLLATLFSSAGAEVALAASGDEALHQFSTVQPDVLLCDIGMPGMDGYEVITRLRKIEQKNSLGPTPAIALTAYARSQDRTRALDAGFDAHMAKPIDPAHLLKVVADAATRV